MHRALISILAVAAMACDPDQDPSGTPARVFFSDGASLRELVSGGGDPKVVVAGTTMQNYPTALAVDTMSKRLFWTDNVTDALSAVSYDGAGAIALATATDLYANPAGVAVDAAHDWVYWGEGHVLRRAHRDGSGNSVIVSGISMQNYITGVAVSPTTQRVYWTDNVTDALKACDSDGSNVVQLYRSADVFNNPRGVAIDPGTGYLFWSEGNHVYRAALDGSGVTKIVAGALDQNFPGSLAVDAVRHRIYWSDSGTDGLYVADESGSNPQLLFQSSDAYSNPAGVAVDPG
jgi:DNA-binding beta-propeller fold protein YncE